MVMFGVEDAETVEPAEGSDQVHIAQRRPERRTACSGGSRPLQRGSVSYAWPRWRIATTLTVLSSSRSS